MANKKLESEFLAFVEKDQEAAMAFITGAFVGLMTEVVRRHGGDANLEIKIDGAGNRDITIHPTKLAQQPSQAAA